jgi:hypothetical protein
MQMTRTFLLIWVLSALGLGIYAGDNVYANTNITGGAAFDQLKSLAGTWETTTPEGKLATETVQIMSAGSAVMMTMDGGNGENMVTMFNPDGDAVIATHYCAAKNQPRYVLAATKDPNVLPFEFKDITNLSSPGAGHMRGVVIRIKDADHHTEEWTWRQNGKDAVHTMDFTRKK